MRGLFSTDQPSGLFSTDEELDAIPGTPKQWNGYQVTIAVVV